MYKPQRQVFLSFFQGNGTTMTKDMFLKWLLSEPKFVVWLSTLHRIDAADKGMIIQIIRSSSFWKELLQKVLQARNM